MDTNQLRRGLEHCTSRSPGQINSVLHHLVRQGILPSNGAGRPAAEIGPQHIVTPLLAVGGIAGTVEKAAIRAPAWACMVDCRTGSTSLLDYLSAALGASPNGIREVSICREWPAAVVTHDAGDRVEFGYATGEEARAAGYPAAPVRSELLLPGAALDALMSEARPVEGGWGSP